MQITAELLDNDIAQVEKNLNALTQQLEQVKASLAQTSGALLVLKNIRAYLDTNAPEPPSVPIEDIAEAVGGPGATAEIVPIDKVVDANGKYVEKTQ